MRVGDCLAIQDKATCDTCLAGLPHKRLVVSKASNRFEELLLRWCSRPPEPNLAASLPPLGIGEDFIFVVHF